MTCSRCLPGPDPLAQRLRLSSCSARVRSSDACCLRQRGHPRGAARARAGRGAGEGDRDRPGPVPVPSPASRTGYRRPVRPLRRRAVPAQEPRHADRGRRRGGRACSSPARVHRERSARGRSISASCRSGGWRSCTRRATALVLPSLDEGFGRPLLDAFVRDVPAIASDIPALRELSGGAALLVAEPHDPEAWRKALARAPEPGMVARGRERAAAYAWPEVARRVARPAGH